MFKVAVIWSYVLTTGVMAISGLLTFVLAAILTPESFGMLQLGMAWVVFSQMLLHHGLTIAVQQMKTVNDDQVDAAFWTTIAGAAVFSAIFAALVPAWVSYNNNLAGLAEVSWALIAVTMCTSVGVIPDAMLRRQMQYKGIAVRGLISASIAGVAGVAAAMAGWGVWALVTQQVLVNGIYSLSVWGATKWRPNFPNPRRIIRNLKGMRRESVHTLGGALGVFLSGRMDVLLMGALFGEYVIGIYRFALRLPEMVIDITSRGLQSVSLPELARHQSDRELLGRRLADMVHVSAVLSIPALGVMAATAKPFVLFIGPQWNAAAAPLQILCAVSAVGTFTALLGPAMQAVKRAAIPTMLTWSSAVLSGLGLGGAAWLTREQGIMAQLTSVAWAALVVGLIQLVVTAVLAYGFVLKVSIVPTVRAILPALVAAVAAYGACWLSLRPLLDKPPLVQLLIGGTAGAVAMIGTLWAFDTKLRRMILDRVSARRTPKVVAVPVEETAASDESTIVAPRSEPRTPQHS